MHHTSRFIVAIAIVCGSSIHAVPRYEQTIPGPPAKASSDNRLAALGFSIDYPKKDWNVLVGAGSSLIVFAHKKGDATVAVEKKPVKRPLAQDEINAEIAKLEVEDWQARRPEVSIFPATVLPYNGLNYIVIDFTQPGSQGSEHVRIYSIPRGVNWYRVICTTTQASFEGYKATCHRMAMSLTPTAAATQ
jgi:hypothetical protein